MAHFAKINNSTKEVIEVIVVSNANCLDENGNESEQSGVNYLKQVFGDDSNILWKQTSYNENFRKNFAGVGMTYDAQRDAFIGTCSHNGWVLNETTCKWEPPTQYPNDGKTYRWDNDTTNWVEIV